MWAFKALFEARLEMSQWAEAQNLVANALNRKLISPLYSERAKAALMTAQAAKVERSDEGAKSDQALDNALRASKLKPAFTPAAILAARQLKKAGKIGRAEDVLEAAYQAAPHPALWIAYRDLVSDETPRERATRLAGIADRNPNHRETRLLALERAVIAGAKTDIPLAIDALKDDLSDDKLTKRVCGLMARAAQMLQNRDEAKSWVAKAAIVKGEPEWADMDETGQAFDYGDSDWAALVLHFAQTGQLTHPRFDRGEKTLPELPDLPSRFVPSMPFIRAAQKSSAPIPLPDDPGAMGDAISGHDLDDDEPRPKIARSRAKKTQK
jgi:HemY protein